MENEERIDTEDVQARFAGTKKHRVGQVRDDFLTAMEILMSAQIQLATFETLVTYPPNDTR
jgi:hypothetical protein